MQHHRCLTSGIYTAQALCIEGGLAAGQCNPLYDDAALRAKAGLWVCPAQASAPANPAASHAPLALDTSPWAPQDAAISGLVQREGACSLSAGNATSSCTMQTADAPANDGADLSMHGAVLGAHAAPCTKDRQLGAAVVDTFASVEAPCCDVQVH